MFAVQMGHLRGGMSFVLIGAMYLVSGISGSKAADMAAVAPVLLVTPALLMSRRLETSVITPTVKADSQFVTTLMGEGLAGLSPTVLPGPAAALAIQ